MSNTETTAENEPLQSLKGAIGRGKKLRGALQAMLVPPATTDSDTLNRWPGNQPQAPTLADIQSGDLSQRVDPPGGDRGSVDPYPLEHPYPATPFATDELLPTTYDAPPTTFVAEQVTPQAAAFTRRLALTQYKNELVVPADMRPRKIRVQCIGAGNMYVHLIRPQGDGTAANLDVSGWLMTATLPVLELECTGEVWVVADTATVFANVIVDYSATEATRMAKVLADKVGSVLEVRGTRPCACGSH